ncbi:serinc [Symbiodinium sp. KB8]|nr:serinc [Symbiodinium sp. KB8]
MCCGLVGCMACSVCRCASGSLTGITQRLKLFYALIFTSAVVVAFLLRFYGQDAFVELSSFKLGCTGERCYGVQAAYRLSFALAVFFSTMAGVTVCVPVSHCWRVVRTCVRARALLAPGCSPGVWAVGGLARLVRERSPADNCCPPPPPLRPSIRVRLAQWFHSSLHIVKLIYFLVLAVVTFFIPAGFWRPPCADFFVWYSTFSLVMSVLFVLLQIIIMIDFAFDLQDWLGSRIGRYEQQCVDEGREQPSLCQNGWKVVYLVVMLTLVIGSIVGLAAMWASFPSCATTNAFLSTTIVASLVLFVASIMVTYPESVTAPNPGAIPPAVLMANSVYVAWGALSNNPDTACNPFLAADADSVGVVIVSLIFVALSITWVTLSSAYKGAGVATVGQSHTLVSTEKEAEQEEDHESIGEPASAPHAATSSSAGHAAAASSPLSDAEKGGSTAAAARRYGAVAEPEDGAPASAAEADKGAYLFHLVMLLGSCYLAMLLSNWGTADTKTTATSAFPEASDASMWARMGTQYASWVIYLWILVAPCLCPGRFGAVVE